MIRSTVTIAMFSILLSCGTQSAGHGGDNGRDAEVDAGRCGCSAKLGCGTGCAAKTICDLRGACTTPRYVVNTDGTVTEKVTGVTWQLVLPVDPCPKDDVDGQFGGCFWADAQAYCGSLGVGWRLPTLAEGFSLVDLGNTSDIDSVFTGTPAASFWTSTAFPGSPGLAWAISFLDGRPTYVGDSNIFKVRCVNGSDVGLDGGTHPDAGGGRDGGGSPDGGGSHDGGVTAHDAGSVHCAGPGVFMCGPMTCTLPSQICNENTADASHPAWACSSTPSSCGCSPNCGCVETSAPYNLIPALTCSESSGAVTVKYDEQGIKP